LHIFQPHTLPFHLYEHEQQLVFFSILILPFICLPYLLYFSANEKLTGGKSSSPREPPPQALTEPYVRLSPHTAPICPTVFNLNCVIENGFVSQQELIPPCGWPLLPDRAMPSLRSISITETSSLLQADLPLCSASVLSSLQGLHLDFSLNSRTTGSQVPYKSLYTSHAIFMPVAAWTVKGLPPD